MVMTNPHQRWPNGHSIAHVPLHAMKATFCPARLIGLVQWLRLGMGVTPNVKVCLTFYTNSCIPVYFFPVCWYVSMTSFSFYTITQGRTECIFLFSCFSVLFLWGGGGGGVGSQFADWRNQDFWVIFTEITCKTIELSSSTNGLKSNCTNHIEPYGTICTLSCDRGYKATPSVDIHKTCQSSSGIGMWSGGTFTCTRNIFSSVSNYTCFINVLLIENNLQPLKTTTTTSPKLLPFKSV